MLLMDGGSGNRGPLKNISPLPFLIFDEYGQLRNEAPLKNLTNNLPDEHFPRSSEERAANSSCKKHLHFLRIVNAFLPFKGSFLNFRSNRKLTLSLS